MDGANQPYLKTRSTPKPRCARPSRCRGAWNWPAA